MKTRHVLLTILFGAVLSIGGAMADELVLDDFSDADGVSAIIVLGLYILFLSVLL
jgi:hypothetical protein